MVVQAVGWLAASLGYAIRYAVLLVSVVVDIVGRVAPYALIVTGVWLLDYRVALIVGGALALIPARFMDWRKA